MDDVIITVTNISCKINYQNPHHFIRSPYIGYNTPIIDLPYIASSTHISYNSPINWLLHWFLSPLLGDDKCAYTCVSLSFVQK